MVFIFAVQIDDKLTDEHSKRLMELVSKEKVDEIKKYVFKIDANRTLVGEVLVRFLICRALNISNEQIYFNVNEYGKKELRGRTDLHFNLSHSGKWVVCSIGNYENGIDVEKINPTDIKLAERIFTHSEYLQIKNVQSEKQSQEFMHIWTLKESYIKCVGKGLSIPLDSFEFKKVNGKIRLNGKDQDQFLLEQVQLSEEYYVAVCSNNEEIDRNINYISIRQLLT